MNAFEQAQLDDDRARFNLETLFAADPAEWPLVVARDRWPAGLADGLRSSGLLVDGVPTEHPVCDRCWRHCHVEVEAVRHASGSTVLVGVCEPGEVEGYLTFEPDQRATVRVHPRLLAHRIAEGLGLVGVIDEVVRGRIWRLGHRSIGGARRVLFLARGEPDPHAIDEAGAVLLTGDPQAWAAADAVVLPLRTVIGIHEDCTVDAEGLEAALGRKRKKVVEPIRVPHGMLWQRLTLRVLDDETVELMAPGVRERRTYAELGLADARTGDREPTRAWRLLLKLATNGGTLGHGDPGSGEDERKNAQALREAFRRLFTPEPPGSPVHPWTATEGWRTAFYVVDARPRT